MFIPNEPHCGTSEYAQDLMRGLGKAKTAVFPVFNTGPDSFSFYSKTAAELNQYSLLHVQFDFPRFGKIGISGVFAPFFFRS